MRAPLALSHCCLLLLPLPVTIPFTSPPDTPHCLLSAVVRAPLPGGLAPGTPSGPRGVGGASSGLWMAQVLRIWLKTSSPWQRAWGRGAGDGAPGMVSAEDEAPGLGAPRYLRVAEQAAGSSPKAAQGRRHKAAGSGPKSRGEICFPKAASSQIRRRRLAQRGSPDSRPP